MCLWEDMPHMCRSPLKPEKSVISLGDGATDVSCLACVLGTCSSPWQEPAPDSRAVSSQLPAPTLHNLKKHQSLGDRRTLGISIRGLCTLHLCICMFDTVLRSCQKHYWIGICFPKPFKTLPSCKISTVIELHIQTKLTDRNLRKRLAGKIGVGRDIKEDGRREESACITYM